MSWKEFVRKGYFVVPAEAEKLRSAVNFRWFAEDRPKDIAEPQPLPSQWAGDFGKGLQTPSGKLEFIPETLRRSDPDNPERPLVNRYIPAWEGPHSTELVGRFPLQLIATHSRFSFHTQVDGKGSFTNDIEDHRLLVDGHYYWLIRISEVDARSRGISHRSLVKVFNERGTVICAADVSPLLAPGVVKSFEASAEYKVVVIDGQKVEIGGCMNTLTPSRSQIRRASSMSPNSCLVQVEPWQPEGRRVGQ
jgi:trimethylamine-N-oxide reductase (cytochrome c)